MGHDTLNNKVSIPDLPRNPHIWDTPPADMLYSDHLIDPSTADTLREEWLSYENDSNPLVSAEKDVKELRYGPELGKRAFDLKSLEAEDGARDEEYIDKDHEEDA